MTTTDIRDDLTAANAAAVIESFERDFGIYGWSACLEIHVMDGEGDDADIMTHSGDAYRITALDAREKLATLLERNSIGDRTANEWGLEWRLESNGNVDDVDDDGREVLSRTFTVYYPKGLLLALDPEPIANYVENFDRIGGEPTPPDAERGTDLQPAAWTEAERTREADGSHNLFDTATWTCQRIPVDDEGELCDGQGACNYYDAATDAAGAVVLQRMLQRLDDGEAMPDRWDFHAGSPRLFSLYSCVDGEGYRFDITAPAWVEETGRSQAFCDWLNDGALPLEGAAPPVGHSLALGSTYLQSDRFEFGHGADMTEFGIGERGDTGYVLHSETGELWTTCDGRPWELRAMYTRRGDIA